MVDADERSSAVRHALDLLCRARLCHRVVATDGAGVPLAAAERSRYFKVLFLDTGIAAAALGLSVQPGASLSGALLVNEGALAEQVIGQLLRTIEPRFIELRLFCWSREQKGSEAELDYLIQHGSHVVPVEVKAGATGTLKSLHLFMSLRRLATGIRCNADMPSLVRVDAKTTTGEAVNYQLMSLPFYLVGQTHRLLDEVGVAPA